LARPYRQHGRTRSHRDARFRSFRKIFPEPPAKPEAALCCDRHLASWAILGDSQLEAQHKAVCALAYGLYISPYLIAENQIAKLGSPQLVILPSPQSLNEKTWQTLLAYVRAGGSLVITGPVSRDQHWQFRDRV